MEVYYLSKGEAQVSFQIWETKAGSAPPFLSLLLLSQRWPYEVLIMYEEQIMHDLYHCKVLQNI